MPELPEVETVKNGLQDLVGQTINQVVVRFPRLRYPLDEKILNQAAGQQIIAITRRAKYLVIHLETGFLICHLGMSGRLTLFKSAPDLIKHDHFDIVTANFTLRYNDPRRFGCLLYATKLDELSMLNELGPEPLEKEFTAEYLHKAISKRKTPIKQLIMDNAIVVGVGNIYACESLFLCGISPLRAGNQITMTECQQLVKIIKRVLQQAIAAGGSSLRDYKNANGELGYFQQSHNVYGRAKQACKVCNTLILDVRLGQRNSFYCPNCQL